MGFVVMAGIRANGPMALAGVKRGEFQTDHYHSALRRLASEQQIDIGQLTSGNALEHGYASKRADTFVGEIAPTEPWYVVINGPSQARAGDRSADFLKEPLDSGTANEYSFTNIRDRARAGDRAGFFVVEARCRRGARLDGGQAR